MQTEQRIAAFAHGFRFADLPKPARQVAKQVLLATFGTAIAGAGEDGCAALRKLLLQRGGTAEASVLVFGHRLPAPSAALINGVMCRALDFCDAMAPGLHMGSSLLPAALAAAELRGGCSGAEFLTAMAVGAEIGSRLNLSEAQYDGFDPTGVAGIFAATATAARLLGLGETKTLHALALAFNRAGGSFQSNVDGSLAVRLIQGWVAETAVNCALLADAGLTGPVNFLGGVYGYAHLFGRGRLDPQSVVEELGRDFRLTGIMFKKYPSCGLTQGVTELTLQACAALALRPEQVREVAVTVPPYAYRLVGHPFRLGDNPRVNAQFSIQYCVASAIVHGSARLQHFRPEAIVDPAVQQLIGRISVTADPALDRRGHTAVDLALETSDGRRHACGLDIAPGFPGNGLDDAAHLGRFRDCLDYAAEPIAPDQAERLRRTIESLEQVADVRSLLPLATLAAETRPARVG